MSDSLKTELYRALLAVQKAWESDSEDGLDEMEAAIYDHVKPAIARYQRERDAARYQRERDAARREESEMSNINETIAEVLRLDELSEDLSPAPWHMSGVDSQHVQDDAGEATADAYCSNDAALIAYYRTAAPALAREVKRLQAECIDLHSALDLSCEREARAYLRGQEAMRDRFAALVDRAADAACECDGTLCGPDDVAPHDEDCRRFDLDDLAGAIRALEVE